MHPDALIRRGRHHGWTVTTDAAPAITLERHPWHITVTFTGMVPRTAFITGPGLGKARPINLRRINTLLRASPADIAEHAAQAIMGGCGDRAQPAGP
ncbi:hypothetical protein ACFFR3_22015 [Nonomuraea salmonea]|uniref:Uncharacterized protein n=1 Tax=Nonomuraea salmonea TaxID=46181 RepID=A0ABV5NPE7_9ACTN